MAIFFNFLSAKNDIFLIFDNPVTVETEAGSGKQTVFLWLWVKRIPQIKFEPNLRLCVPDHYVDILVLTWNCS